MRIESRDISFSFGKNRVLNHVNFSADNSEMIAVIGPNGVGKTTFFRCLLGFLKPDEGEIRVDGKPISSFNSRELAREIAYIPQSFRPAFNLSVLDSVLMGTASSLGVFQQPTESDIQRAMQSLKMLGIDHLADRGSQKISGGERQLMLLSRALLQNARILIMDEPTANLDYGNSFHVMQKIVQLKENGYTIIFSSHDPDQALRYASRVVAMHDGAIIADGKPSQVMTPELMKTLYKISVAIVPIQAGVKSYSVCTPFEE